jgi:hypothetical protein
MATKKPVEKEKSLADVTKENKKQNVLLAEQSTKLTGIKSSQQFTNVKLDKQIDLFQKYFDRLNAQRGDDAESEAELLAALKDLKSKDKSEEKKQEKSIGGLLGMLGRIFAGIRGIPMLLGAALGSIGTLVFGKTGFAIVKGLSKAMFRFTKFLIKAPFQFAFAIAKFLGKGIAKLPGIRGLLAARQARAAKAATGLRGLAMRGVSQKQIARMPNMYGKQFSAQARSMTPQQFAKMQKGGRAPLRMPAFLSNLRGGGKTAKDASKVGKSSGMLSGLFAKLGKIFPRITKGVKGMGKFLGAFLVPLRIIFTVFETVKGALDGFKRFKGEGMFAGLVAATIGGIGGALKAIIGYPFDLVKDIAAWVLGKFGMNNAAEFLKSFSVSDMIGNLFGAITDKLFSFVDAMKDETGKISVGSFLKVAFAGLIDMFTAIPRKLLTGAAEALDGKRGMGWAAAGLRKAASMIKMGDNVGLDDAYEARREEREEYDKAELERKEAKRAEKLEKKKKEAAEAERQQKLLEAQEIAALNSGPGGMVDASTTSIDNSSQTFTGGVESAKDPMADPNMQLFVSLMG